MHEPIKILIAEPQDFSPRAVSILQQIGQVDLCECEPGHLKQALADYDVFWFRLAHRISRELLTDDIRCRILATPVTGIDHIDLEACTEHGIQVACLRGEYEFLKKVRATAELTVALTLGLLRHVPDAAASVRDGTWNRDLFRGNELFEKTAGIVGMGRLGNIVAGYFRAFGMRVIGYDPRPDFPLDVAERAETLFELLEQCDVVSIHVKYDELTRHLFQREHFTRMKKSSVLINTSRGGIVDDNALLWALDAGQIAGAALDVLDGEPHITADHPILQYSRNHSNVLVVPHIGGNTEESFAKTEVFLALRVLELAQTGALSSRVRVRPSSEGSEQRAP